jgi:hypothetical protein
VLLKVKQSHYRPGQALRVPGGRGSQISRQSAHEGAKVASPTHRPLLPPPPPQEIFLVFISVRRWIDLRAIVRPKGLCQWKIPMTPSGIEPATYLNQLRHRVPPVCVMSWGIFELLDHNFLVKTSRFESWNCFRHQVQNTNFETSFLDPLHWANAHHRCITKLAWLGVTPPFGLNRVDTSTPFHLRKGTDSVSKRLLSFSITDDRNTLKIENLKYC